MQDVAEKMSAHGRPFEFISRDCASCGRYALFEKSPVCAFVGIDEPELSLSGSATLRKRINSYSRHCLHTNSGFGRRLLLFVGTVKLATLSQSLPLTPLNKEQSPKECRSYPLVGLILTHYGLQGRWK